MRVRQRHASPRPSRPLMRLGVAGALAAVAATSWTSLAPMVSAAPNGPVQAPFVESAIAGLRQGSQGSDVTALQKALMAAGVHVSGGADGVFGPGTKRAVIAFQKARGLAQTGEVDEATAAALAGDGATTSATSGNGYVGLQQGAEGPAVEAVQRKLIEFGVYLGTGADGVWGASTTRAVKQFQGWNGLVQTGTINVATEKKLGLDGSVTPTAATAPPPTTATTVTTSSNPYVGLKQGAQGPEVTALQKALQQTGLVVRGGADGVFGPATTSALKAFQGFNGLTRNGIVSERTAELLQLGTSAPATPPAAANPYLGLAAGATGSLVKDVQQALMDAGVSVRGGADGAFGNATKSALISYQKATGVTADGTVNQATIDKLGLGSSRGPVPFGGGATNQTATPPSSSNPYVGLKSGSVGPLVKELQQALLNTGLVIRGGADGVFGSATTSALKAFQSVNGIAQTGVVTERGASIMALGTGTVTPTSSGGGGNIKIDRFPVQGQCFFGDTWHAPRGGGRLHLGVDIIAAQGKLLYAVVDGEVSKLYWDQPGALAGNGLRIEQPNGTYFTYLHLSSFAPGIKLGTKVKAGDVIGFVGSTGSSATPHLHLEIHPYGGAAINPYPFMKAIDDCGNDTPRYQSSFS